MENIQQILIDAHLNSESLNALSKRLKIGRSTLTKKAKEFGLDFTKLKTRGGKINTTLRIGEKFGKLTIKSYDSRNDRGSIWLCECECGNEIKVPIGLLYRSKGSKKSCGCEKNKNKIASYSPYWKGHGEISSTKWSQIKRNAKKRNIEFNLTIKDAYDVYLNQNKMCKLSGLEIDFKNKENLASLDRINSALPYDKNNIQWVHKKVNYMKHCLSNEELIFFCNLICINNGK